MPEAIINNATRVNIVHFTPSSYTADLVMDNSAQVVALATGVKKGAGQIRVVNQGATTEAVRVAFGTSSSGAGDNLTIVTNAATTGTYVPALADAGGGAVLVLGVPSWATHVAVSNAVAGDVHSVALEQGV